MNSAPRFLRFAPPIAAAAALYLGCGGKVVVDASSGAGGDGGDTTTTATTMSTATSSSSVTATTGTGDACNTLAQIYDKALVAAAQCNACIDFDGCINGPTFIDTCGCQVVLNSDQPDLTAQAKEANANWLGAGCQPFACGKPCFAGTSWSCHPGPDGNCVGSCQPN